MAIDVNTILGLETKYKALIFFGLMAAIGALFYFFPYTSQLKALKARETQLAQLRKDIDEKRALVKDIEIYKSEIKELDSALAKAFSKLPDEKEIPGLLLNISKAGNASGLEFNYFKPGKESPKGFYAEIPVDIKVEGLYRDHAVFFHKLKNMSRIVNVTNLMVISKKGKGRGGTSLLNSNFKIVTFMFLKQERGGKKKKKR